MPLLPPPPPLIHPWMPPLHPPPPLIHPWMPPSPPAPPQVLQILLATGNHLNPRHSDGFVLPKSLDSIASFPATKKSPHFGNTLLESVLEYISAERPELLDVDASLAQVLRARDLQPTFIKGAPPPPPLWGSLAGPELMVEGQKRPLEGVLCYRRGSGSERERRGLSMRGRGSERERERERERESRSPGMS